MDDFFKKHISALERELAAFKALEAKVRPVLDGLEDRISGGNCSSYVSGVKGLCVYVTISLHTKKKGDRILMQFETTHAGNTMDPSDGGPATPAQVTAYMKSVGWEPSVILESPAGREVIKAAVKASTHRPTP